jgi:RNA polymerase-binding protein DksA
VNRNEKLDLEDLEQELEQRRAVLLSRLHVKGEADDSDDSIETANPDRADLAQDYFLQDRQTALRDRLEGTLEQVEDALERINKGIYGKCKDCGKDISVERLHALPYAELCIECKGELEGKTR